MGIVGQIKTVTMYTDGGCDPNPGVGGFGVVLLHGARRRELSGAFRLTTNNRMEVMAAIVGLEAIKMPCRVEIFSDSKYLVHAVEKRWLQAWEARGWRRKDGEPVPNADLWKRLLEMCQKHEVKLSWVAGHSGVAENERCDQMAAEARRAGDLPVDEGYLAGAQVRAQRQLPLGVATPAPGAPVADVPVREEGQPCRKCGTPVVRRTPKRTKNRGKLYVYLFYLYCVGCRTLYLVDAAKTDPNRADARREKLSPGGSPARSMAAPRPVPRSEPIVTRVYEVALDPRPDRSRFAAIAARLDSRPDTTLVRELQGPGHQLREYRVAGNPVTLELHPERGLSISVRGKRNRDLLLDLSAQLP